MPGDVSNPRTASASADAGRTRVNGNRPAVKWLLWVKTSSHAKCVLIALFVFVCTLTVRHLGWFQFLEFQMYDFFVRHRAKAATPGPIVLVEMTEADIQSPSLDYPIPDDKLAELLRGLAADQPAVIGLDIWRDIPVPKSGVGLHEFNEVMQAHSNIVAIFTLGGIAPPPVLKSNPERVAFDDNFPIDYEVDDTVPKVRRSLLFVNTLSGESFDSFPFLVAALYLRGQGIEPEPDREDPESFRLGKARMRAFGANDGAYVGVETGGWQMLLDFRCPDNFARHSFGEVLSGQVPPGTFRDKIVVVGINAPSFHDERVTPVRRDHRRVRLQASAVNQLLRQALEGEPPLRVWRDLIEDAWILLWCLLGGAIGYWARSPWRFAPATVVCLIGLPAIAWKAFGMGWWIPVATPAVAIVCAMALVVSYASSQERFMRTVLMKLYSRHVSEEIAESIWANRDSFLDGRRPLAQKLVVTVLFTDLKGFTRISEELEAARLYTWLNGYLGAMAQVIQNHGGVLKQFTGDGILTLFGVPVPHTTRLEQSRDATAAVKCALAMGQRLVELSHEWRKAGLPAVSMRAGIYTGEVAAGSVGSDDRFEYAVVGDVVNTASRLESYDKTFADPDGIPTRCRILIGGPTHELLDGKYLTREIGLLEVKGRIARVPVFQILGEHPSPIPTSCQPNLLERPSK
jgi:adenylate cyclase